MSGTANNTMLEVQNLVSGYGKLQILHGVNLRLERGECITVIGPNGAGKTTLLRAIAGIQPASSGTIFYRGSNTTRQSAEQLASQKLALVPEGRELFSSMSVEDNLILGAYTRYQKRETGIAQTLSSIYALFPRLAERKKQLAGTMSGGEQQMLAVGRALMLEPELLILDEPSLGLAPLIIQEIMNVIASLKRGGTSILLVEQNARAALSVADRAYVLEGGQVAMEGTALQLRQDPRVTSIYLGGHVVE
jgi:branched-chain amino acid transport system ATP-binding protein